MKILKINSTRTTAIGTLRRGTVVRVNDSDPRVSKIIKSLTKGDNPAVKVISEAEAEKIATKVQSLEPKREGKKAEVKVRDAVAAQKAAEKRLAEREEELRLAKEGIAELEKSGDKIAELEAAVEKADKDRDSARAAQAAAEQALDDAKTEISEGAKALAEAHARIAELEAAAAQPKDGGKSGDGGK